MSKNVNVFIGVLLCAVLCGTFVWLSSSGDESSWSPNDIYNEVQGTGSVGGYATTSATFSGPSNDGGVALPMSSSSMRARTSYKYAGAYSGASYAPLASSPLASSPLTYGAASGAGLYTTSSAEIKSFGGGGNGGASMSYSQSSISNLQSPIANSQSPIANLQSPIAYSTARRGGMSSAAGDDLAMMAAENPVMAMTNAASVGMGTGFYGAYSVMDYSSASYAEYTGMFGGGSRMGVRGRQNSSLTDSWLDWLYRYGYSWGTQSGDPENGYYYTFTEQQLRDAYNDYINNYWDSMWGPDVTKPDFDEWLTWLQNGGDNGYGYKGNWYMMAPVGDIIPLLLLALLYIVAMYLRSKSRIQVMTK